MKNRFFVLFTTLVLLAAVFMGACAKTPVSTPESDTGRSSPGRADVSRSTEDSSAEADSSPDGFMEEYLAGFEGDHMMRFVMHMTVDGADTKSEITVAVKNEALAYKMEFEGALVRFVQKDGDFFIIDDNQKMAMNMAIVGVDLSTIAPPEYIGDDVAGTGIDDAMGESLPYIEYSISDSGSIRYYFNGKNLAYIVGEESGETFIMEIQEYTQNVPDSLYDIPADYTVVNSFEDLMDMG